MGDDLGMYIVSNDAEMVSSVNCKFMGRTSPSSNVGYMADVPEGI